MIKIVIEAHSLPSDSDEDIQMFYDAFINKLSDMKARLFSTPGYAAFLKDEFPNLLSECEKEIAEYNLEFCDKNTGEIKGIAVHNFKKRSKNLNEISFSLPFTFKIFP